MVATQNAAWRTSRRKRVEASLIAAIGTPLIGGIGSTWRWHVEGLDAVDALERAGRAPILALWHGRILAATILLKHRGIVALASDNFDGEWIARILTRFGYVVARGSSSRGGVRALVRLRQEVRQGKTTAFTVDGPRGPIHCVQPGCVWLARETGRVIVPFHIEARSAWTVSSWDRAQIPRPFARVAACFGEPVTVAPSTSDEELEGCRAGLERTMVTLMERTKRVARDQE